MNQILRYCVLLLATVSLVAQQAVSLTSKQIFEKTTAASLIVLTGEGAGRLHGILSLRGE